MAQRNFQEIALLLHRDDDVAVLKRPLKTGDVVRYGSGDLHIAEPIAAGHKLAVKAITAGAPVRKYGQVIGFAQAAIPPGAHVHTHNLVLQDFDRDYAFCAEAKPIAYYPAERMRFFEGYARPGGQV